MSILRAVMLLIWATTVAATAAHGAGREPTRAEALRALSDEAADARLAGIERLARIGTMTDAHRLAVRLRDVDPRVRAAAELAMWRIWSRSGDPSIDALFGRGVEQMSQGRLDEALSTFATIVERKPDFAEGWNKRATVLYLLGRHEASLRDCDEVVRRNPNHFGALAGQGQNFLGLGQEDRALEAFSRALEVNPNLDGAAMAVRLLERRLEERRKRSI